MSEAEVPEEGKMPEHPRAYAGPLGQELAPVSEAEVPEEGKMPEHPRAYAGPLGQELAPVPEDSEETGERRKDPHK